MLGRFSASTAMVAIAGAAIGAGAAVSLPRN
jgi:hypothetical protein